MRKVCIASQLGLTYLDFGSCLPPYPLRIICMLCKPAAACKPLLPVLCQPGSQPARQNAFIPIYPKLNTHALQKELATYVQSTQSKPVTVGIFSHFLKRLRTSVLRMFLGNALEEHHPHLAERVKNGEKWWNIVEQRILLKHHSLAPCCNA